MNGFNFLQASPIPPISDVNWEVVGTGDFDGDGTDDTLWHNRLTGQMVIWFMQGTNIGSYQMISYIVSDLNWQVVGIGDFDGDGKADILWRNSDGSECHLADEWRNFHRCSIYLSDI
jgi:hypothetical protein